MTIKREEVTKSMEQFCNEYLNESFIDRANNILNNIELLEDNPLSKSKENIWAATAIYTLCENEGIFNKGHENYISKKDLCAFFSTSPTTIRTKFIDLAEKLNNETNSNKVIAEACEVEKAMDEVAATSACVSNYKVILTDALNLWSMRKKKEALTMLREIQEVEIDGQAYPRYYLIHFLIMEYRLDEAQELLNKYDDNTATWLYAKALFLYRKNKLQEAEQTLKVAVDSNKTLVDYLLKKKDRPTRRLNGFVNGDDTEGVYYYFNYSNAWNSSVGALGWLNRILM